MSRGTLLPGRSHTKAVHAGSTLNDGLLDVMYAMDLSQEQVKLTWWHGPQTLLHVIPLLHDQPEQGTSRIGCPDKYALLVE